MMQPKKTKFRKAHKGRIHGVAVQTAREALSLAAAKLPIKTRFVERIAE